MNAGGLRPISYLKTQLHSTKHRVVHLVDLPTIPLYNSNIESQDVPQSVFEFKEKAFEKRLIQKPVNETPELEDESTLRHLERFLSAFEEWIGL
ncbi:hypothetical protein [Paenibacillus sp. JNUCC31]|uniref:hypothetical protein n=1 Tax=Paenibacillus sp. JNUCC-31 TaxID=2777983 RepID=UPI001E59F642|nr:hypothetical protein [Paenibacillus sp. JNUCC-31]